MNHSEPTCYWIKPAKLLVMVFLWFSCFSFLNTAGYTGESVSPVLPTTELVQTVRVPATYTLVYKRPLLVFRATIGSVFFSGRKNKQITRLHDSLIKVKFSQLTRLAHSTGKPTWFINQIRMPQPSTDDYLTAARH